MRTDLTSKSLESQTFSWEEWDGDIEMMQFYNCILKVPLKTPERAFEECEEIRTIAMFLDTSRMEFYDNEGNVIATFQMKLTLE